MKKLYTQKQYKEYSNLLQKMADCDDVLEGANIHFQINQWLEENNISETAQQQMDDIIEKEFYDELNGVKPNEKVIKFPNRNNKE